MTRRSRLVLSVCLLGALACGDDDSGMTGRDSGPAADAGPDRDAGGGVDAGPGVDSGPGEEDAGGGVDSGPPEGCEGGPLAEPIPGCTLDPPPSTGDLAQDCVNRINQFRWECQCLPPLDRWMEGEACATMHAEYDANGAGPHGGFRDRICSPGGRGQNECPGYRSNDQVIGLCLQQMWDEGPGEPFSEHGHYINMTNPAHSRVACGFYTTGDGRVWAVQNFN